MTTVAAQSDRELLDDLRRRGSASIQQLVDTFGVTTTAIRQRLNRLMAEGLVERRLTPAGRGRPSHHYSLTEKGRSLCGTNYDDLAVVLWEEIRSINDPTIRAGLLRRLAQRMAQRSGAVDGDTLGEKMTKLAAVMGERDVLFEVNNSGGLPVLRAVECPYPELAQRDRSICSVEKMLFSELLGAGVRLSDCRFEGATCCSFVPTQTGTPVAVVSDADMTVSLGNHD